MSSLKFVTWNVRGIGTRDKKLKILNHLNFLEADIALLQETHLTNTTAQNLKSTDFPNIYPASYNSKQRGVAILIKKRLNFIINSTISDPNGRYIIINTNIDNKDYCIASIYGPNVDDPSFYHAFFLPLSAHVNTTLIVGGDFNLVLDSDIDRSNTSASQRHSLAADTLKQYMSDFGLSDPWRSNHPTHREYTFFSSVHHSYSRLDYFITSNSLLADIREAQIHSITISDHAPASICISTKAPRAPIWNWRLNTSLLIDPDFIKYFNREWTIFLEINDLHETPVHVLWETAKAVMRGKIISYSCHKKKKELALECELINNIKTLESSYAIQQEEDVWKELCKLKTELAKLTDKKIKFQMQRLRLENFECNNNSSKFLANQLKSNRERATISSIKNLDGKLTHNPDEINQCFRDFYKKLYSSDNNPSEASIDNFLNSIVLPKLNQEQATTMDADLTQAEFEEALAQMPLNKAPGPDGFPVEFYKALWPTVGPTYYRMAREILNTGLLSSNMNSANISLILKPDKDPSLPTSYRPISLINTDLKIICKAIARRLEKITPYIIHPDQTGFIKGRDSTSNVRRFINLIDYTNANNLQTTIVSLDAEKAFDRVNWNFLFATLQKFGFGNSFISWIRTLYSSPCASVRTNSQISQRFNLQRGTRQGCPLSPSLFAMFIEPLAAAIRQNENIKGVQISTSDHKISLYADDVLLFLRNTQSSLAEVITLIDNFSCISDYSINWAKSTVLPLNCKFKRTSLAPLQAGNIRYLGISFSPNLSDLIQLNFIPLLKKIENDLIRWRNLPISLLEKVATVKMMVLPKLNYLFSMIPYQPPAQWFKTLNSNVTMFLWKNKPPRISLKTLQKAKDAGGLDLPNFYYYYIANRIKYIHKWFNPSPHDVSWHVIEQAYCGDIQLADLPFISTPKHHSCMKSVNISHSLTAWTEFLKITGSSLLPCGRMPIWNNPDILQNKKVLNFTHWADKGITHVKHIRENNNFRPFQELVTQFGINSSCYLEYMQIKSIIKKKFKLKLEQTHMEVSPAVQSVLNFSPPKLLSKIYKILTNTDRTISIPTVKWERDLSLQPHPNFWRTICLNTFSLIKQPNLQLIQFKVLHRIHYTGQRMFQMGMTASQTCSHCTVNVPDNYLHAVWHCPPVNKFWHIVCNDLSAQVGYTITATPSFCLLGDLTDITSDKAESRMLITSLSIAKKTILINWKSKQHLHIAQYRNLLLDHTSLVGVSASSFN